MSRRLLSVLIGCPGLVVLGALAGCGHGPGPGEARQAPKVKVSKPVWRDVTDYADFTGRTDAVPSVQVRARVSGYLDQVLFPPGAEVKKDQKLFKIDPRPYQATLDQAKGQVAANEASLKRYTRDVTRNRPLVRTGAVSPQEFDTMQGNMEQAAGSLVAARANVVSSQLDLTFTDVLSPFDGRVGRNLIDVGNLVTKDQTLLTTVVSEDPMYAYFDVDERTMLRVQKLIREGKFKAARTTKEVPLSIGLANEQGHPHQGTIDFVDNQVNTSTGTIQVRGSFPNPSSAAPLVAASDALALMLPHGQPWNALGAVAAAESWPGTRLLTPGLFVRVRVPIGDPHKAVLISDRAIGSDQGVKYVFVLGANNRIERRTVTLGALHDGLREVRSGLEPDERVVVAGLQRLASGEEVRAEEVPMPVPPKGASAQP
jgi:RND family efflux transporter MFP subunit